LNVSLGRHRALGAANEAANVFNSSLRGFFKINKNMCTIKYTYNISIQTTIFDWNSTFAASNTIIVTPSWLPNAAPCRAMRPIPPMKWSQATLCIRAIR